MATITPTFTLKANANSATNSPGPLSVALSLTANDSLTVDTVTSLIINPTTTDSRLLDGSNYDDTGVAGAGGGFIYLKNISAGDYDIYFGAIADGGTVTDLEAADDADRFMTLKQGEFAFLPWDYTMDITCDAEHNDATLEYWIFNRA